MFSSLTFHGSWTEVCQSVPFDTKHRNACLPLSWKIIRRREVQLQLFLTLALNGNKLSERRPGCFNPGVLDKRLGQPLNFCQGASKNNRFLQEIKTFKTTYFIRVVKHGRHVSTRSRSSSGPCYKCRSLEITLKI